MHDVKHDYIIDQVEKLSLVGSLIAGHMPGFTHKITLSVSSLCNPPYTHKDLRVLLAEPLYSHYRMHMKFATGARNTRLCSGSHCCMGGARDCDPQVAQRELG